MLLLFKYNHKKKYHKSLTLKTYFYLTKSLRIQERSGVEAPGSSWINKIQGGPQIPCLQLAPPLTLNPGSAPEIIDIPKLMFLLFKT